MTEPTSANIGAHELEISGAVFGAGFDAYFDGSKPRSDYDIIRAVICAAAPLIVATELRQMESGISEGAFLERLLDNIRSPALTGILSYLHKRIDHLDPEGLTRDR